MQRSRKKNFQPPSRPTKRSLCVLGRVVESDVPGCDKDFANKDGLRVHKKSAHQGLKFQCQQCLQHFVAKIDLDKHVLKVHEGGTGEKFKCEYCEKDFARHRNMRNHVRVIHADERNYKCSTCGNAFGQSEEGKI